MHDWPASLAPVVPSHPAPPGIGFVLHDWPSSLAPVAPSHPASPEIGFVLHDWPSSLALAALSHPAPPGIGFVLHAYPCPSGILVGWPSPADFFEKGRGPRDVGRGIIGLRPCGPVPPGAARAVRGAGIGFVLPSPLAGPIHHNAFPTRHLAFPTFPSELALFRTNAHHGGRGE